MDEELQQQIQRRMSELPDDVRQAIQSADLGKKLQEIGTKHKFHIDQVGILSDETVLILLGFADPGEFADTLVRELHITPEEAEKVAGDVAEQVFFPIRESMQAFMEGQETLTQALLVAETPSASKPATPFTDAVRATPTDHLLTEKTVVTPPSRTYKTDPYREPPE